MLYDLFKDKCSDHYFFSGKASGLVTITRWLLGFAVTFLFQYLMITIKPHNCYWVFSACCLAGAIFVYIFLPETKGKTLDEIQIFFKNKNESETKPKQEQICSPAVIWYVYFSYMFTELVTMWLMWINCLTDSSLMYFFSLKVFQKISKNNIIRTFHNKINISWNLYPHK